MRYPPKIAVCVGGIVLFGNRALLVKQTYGKLKDRWTIPWGFVEEFEFPDKAVLREIEEEAGVEAKIDGIVCVQNFFEQDVSMIAIVFLCHHVEGTPKTFGEETSEARYFSLGEIEDMRVSVDEFSYHWIIKVLKSDYSLIPQSNPRWTEKYR